MHPILFEIPGLGFPIQSFGVMVVLGFLLGSHLYARLGQRYALDPEAEMQGYYSVPMWILGGILIGARAMYVLVEVLKQSEVGKAYVSDPLTVFYYWEGGLVMYGGTFGGIALGLWAARRHRMQLWHALDLGLTAGFFGLAVGRIGCLLVGDDYGSIVPEYAKDWPFPLVLDVPSPLPEKSLFGEMEGKTIWATQPWMSANAALMGFIGMALIKRRRYFGQASLILLVLYSIARFTIESFRGDSVRGLWFNDTISTSQLVSIVLGTLSVVMLFLLRGRRDEEVALRNGAAAAR